MVNKSREVAFQAGIFEIDEAYEPVRPKITWMEKIGVSLQELESLVVLHFRKGGHIQLSTKGGTIDVGWLEFFRKKDGTKMIRFSLHGARMETRVLPLSDITVATLLPTKKRPIHQKLVMREYVTLTK
jgi:hypothetical protein